MSELILNGLSVSALNELTADILKEAKKIGADEAEVGIGLNKGFTVTSRKGDVESVEYNQDKSISIAIFKGKRTGHASLSDLRKEAISAAIQAAYNIAKYSDEDPFSGLADKELLAFDFPQPDSYFPWDISVESAIQSTKQCEADGLKVDKRIVNSEGSAISTVVGMHCYGNTRGFIGSFPVSRHEASCILIGKNGKDMQRDYYYTVACDPIDLEPLDQVAKKAAERTIRRLGARKLTTRQVPVLFAPEESRGLIGLFLSAISGGSLYRKSSFLLDHLGKKIFPEKFTFSENPFLEKGLGSSPFDDDGVRTRPNVFVKDGILNSYSLGVYSARKLGMQTTGNAGGVHNLSVTTGNQTFSELLKTMDKGLVVTELMGQGINLVTGDYSRGAAGFWVENGEIQYPVQEITIASNLKEMFANIVEIGNDVDRRGNVATGSILVESMTVAGS